MAFVVSPGATRPGGYSSVGQTGHDVDANGHEDFIMRLRRFVCGVPELDPTTPVTAVGTHDTTISRIDGSDSSMTLGTWQVRRQSSTVLRIVEPGPINHDITVTWGTVIDVNVFGNDAVAPLTFELDDTGADQLINTEGFDLIFVANGLPAAEAWHREAISNTGRATDIDFEMVLRGRKVSGVTDPTLVPDVDKFFVELQSISNVSAEKYQLRQQWVSLVPDYSLAEIPPVLSSLVRCPMWTETGVSGPRLMPYYIVANHRWCIYVINVDGNFFGGYFGLMDAFATNTQYPLPFLNGGTGWAEADIYTLQDRDISWAHMSNNQTTDNSNLYFRTPEGSLEPVETPFVNVGGGPGSNTVISSSTAKHQVWPWGCPAKHATEAGFGTTYLGFQTPGSVGVVSTQAHPLRGALDGTKIFIPTTLVRNEPNTAGPSGNDRHILAGHIPFVFYTNGFGISGGDVIASASRDFLMVPNVYRSAEQGFWALELA